MAWIKTIPMSEADDKLKAAMSAQRSLYPEEYNSPVQPSDGDAAGIVSSHTLIPDALHHAFATFGSLMSPDLPLTRRQHEMITTAVSATNRCVYVGRWIG
jgi:alkylhydroperoxidase family enzyme